MPRRHDVGEKLNGVAKTNGWSTAIGANGASHTAGTNGISSALPEDVDDPSYVREMQRPAVIKEDLWAMERRRRVRQVLGAKDFRDELEETIATRPDASVDYGCWEGGSTGGANHLLTNIRHTSPTGMSTSMVNLSLQPQGSGVIPICDFSLGSASKYSKQERVCRNKLASLYRLVDLFQWSQGIYNHITVRLPSKTLSDPPEILINPFGLLYHEITASSLIKLNLAGEILDPGSTQLGINQAGYVLHSAIHEAREDVRCVLHLHTPVVSTVSSMKCGLLPICQEAIIIGPVGYHDYKGIVSEEEEKRSIVEDLGDRNMMLLRNHGLVACGQSVEDALHLAFHCILACETMVLLIRGDGFLCCGQSIPHALHVTTGLIRACEHQIRASRAGLENIIIPDEAAIRRAYETARRGGGGVNRLQKPASMISPTTSMTKSVSESGNMAVTSQPPADNTTNNGAGWRIGELEWEAWMRALDGAGFRTGHLYRQPHLRASSSASCPRTQLPPVPRTPHTHSRLLSSGGYYSALNLSEIATPPSCSATGTLDESNHEAVARDRLALLRREQERVRWLHSPNCYQRVRILESGTDKPRVFTKWVQESGVGARSSSQCTPVKTTSQFSPPLGTTGSGDPRELKHRQRLLKENRLAGMLGAGPSSNVLETNLRSYEEGLDEWQYNSRPIFIGTASKGIISRPYQHSAQVYSQLYAPNPFRGETDEGIQAYLRDIDLKSRSASSTLDRRVTHQQDGYSHHTYSNGTTLITSTATLDRSLPAAANKDITRAARRVEIAETGGRRSESQKHFTKGRDLSAASEGKAATDVPFTTACLQSETLARNGHGGEAAGQKKKRKRRLFSFMRRGSNRLK